MDDKVRKLGSSEKWYYICDKLSPLNAVITCHIKGSFTKSDVERALNHLQMNHILLQTGVKTEENGEDPYFFKLNNCKIPIHFSEKNFTEALTQELNTRIGYESLPLMRVTYTKDQLGEHDFILCISHIIADGLGGLNLTNEFVTYLAHFASNNPIKTTNDDIQVVESLEDLFPDDKKGILFFIGTLFAQIKLLFFQLFKQPKRLKPIVELPLENRTTKAIQTIMDTETFDKIKKSCKKNSVTIHGALCAATVLAISKKNGNGWYSLGSPVDISTYLKVPVIKKIGCFVATVVLNLKVTEKINFWDLARAVNNENSVNSRVKESFQVLNFLKLVVPKSKEKSYSFARLVERKGPGNIALSNVGKYQMEKNIFNLEVTNVHGFASLSIYGYFLVVACSVHNILNLNFCYIEEAIGDKQANDYASDIYQILQNEAQA